MFEALTAETVLPRQFSETVFRDSISETVFRQALNTMGTGYGAPERV